MKSTVSCLRLSCTRRALTNCREPPGWSWAGAHQVERAGLVQPGEESAVRDLLGGYTYLIRAYRKDGASLLSEVRTENKKITSCIKGNSNHTQGKKVFTVRIVKRWQRLPRGAEEFPSLKTPPRVPQTDFPASPALSTG